MAKDGIACLLKHGHRSNQPRPLNGGATEDTIIARVGQGIVKAIGSMTPIKTYWKIQSYQLAVLGSGLDKANRLGDCFYRYCWHFRCRCWANVGAKLETDRADADKIASQKLGFKSHGDCR